MSTNYPTYYSVAEVATRSGVTRKCVRGWLSAGVGLPDGTRARLAATRHGGLWRIAAADLDAFVSVLTLAHRSPDNLPTVSAPMPTSSSDRARAARDELRRRHSLPV